jgi:serine/threonine protein phosphatase PrpC
MPASVVLKFGSQSVTGNFRENNEDNCRVDPQGRYFLVADGMGGQCAGEKASELAIELISKRMEKSIDFAGAEPSQVQSAIDDAVSHANFEIMALGELDSKYRNMGTTIAFVVAAGGVLYAGGIGDSRIYLLRDGKLEQLTKDHSLTQALLDAGTISPEDAATHRYKNVLYRYLGTKEGSAGTEPKRIEPRPGDRLMLCSDGVTDGINTETIQGLLGSIGDPYRAAKDIVQAALDGGSRDNVTCIVLHVAQ